MNTSRPWMPYLRTLRLIPDPIILAMATRDIELGEPDACVCGWAIRESLAFANGKGASQYRVSEACPKWGQPDYLAATFGGTGAEWAAIFWGVVDERMPNIEIAFVRRVEEAVAG